MSYYSRKKESKNIVIWMSLLFLIGGSVGVYLLGRAEEFNFSYPYYFFASGYLMIIPYLFVKLVKGSGWLLFELPVFDAIIIYIFAPFIFAFLGIWYFIKVLILFLLSFIGVIPYYFWNVGKFVFSR